jgi:LuxR family transcriptional regulator, maltose regulon positive regulatory protein
MTLTVPVVRTKIIIPRRRTEILSRPRLLSILENVLDLKLLILAAPAGYGKTSLLIDFTYHTQLPVCWFAIDSLDTDPQRFIAHFITAIANRFPTFGEASFSALSNLDQDSLNLDPVISAIINDAYEHITEHFVFVLDDYHYVRDSKPIDEFINRVTLEVSENCHLIIASRTLLTLPDLTLLVARSQVGGLSYEELAFLPEEIKQLFSVNYHQSITEKTATDMVEQTEGWITGLLLTAQLSPKETSNRLRLARVSGIGLYEYLAQQVLEQQSDEFRLFLKRTSLLEEFDAVLCEQIFSQVQGIKTENWHERIELLLRENLFVLPVDDETLHLRYHHLFRDFLQNCMRTERPEESRQIESCLATYYEQRKEWERAFEIYSRIGNADQLADLILRAAPSMILGGRLTTLSTWLGYLPTSVRDEQPEFLSIKGSIAVLRGDSKNSLEIMDKAILGLRENQNIEALTATLIRRSWVNRAFGHYNLALDDAKEAIALSKNEPKLMKLNAEALRSIGLSFYQSGELKKALSSFSSSLEKYNQLGEELDAAKVLLDLGALHLALGEFDEADNAYKKSLSFWQATQNSLWQTNLLNNIGVVQHLRGKYEQAAISFEKAITHARLAMNPRLEGFSLASLGDLFRDIRALPEARKAYEMAREASESVNDHALQVFLSLSDATLERLTGDMAASEKSNNTALEIAQKGGSKYEIFLCRLEFCVLDLLQKKFEKLDSSLNEVLDYFSKEGFHLEELRTRYYLAVMNLLVQKSVDSEQSFIAFINSSFNDRDKPTILRIGYETLDLLEEYAKSADCADEVLAFIQELRNIDTTLIPIRKTIRRHSETVQFSTPKIMIRSFGKCQVKICEHSVALSEWKTQMVRDLFFFILQHPDGVTKEEIGEAFWPDSTIETLRVRFKNSIYRLRHALGSESISFIDDYYRFNRLLEYYCDAEDFTQELAIAEKAPDADGKIHHYIQAVNQYRGVYLPKMDYEWAIVQREQYHRSFIASIMKLIDLLLKAGQYQAAIHYVNRAVEEDSCFEEAYRAGMKAFSELGDRASISRYYDKCCAALKKELDLDPAVETTLLYKNLMQ